VRRRTVLASLAGLCGVGSSLALSGCGGASNDDTATLRFINGTVDDASADFWLAGAVAYSALANGGALSSYGSTTAGDVQVALHAAGASTARLTATHAFSSDSNTSVLAYGSLATSLAFKFIDESNAAAASGSFKVRAFQGSPSLGAADVYITNTSSLSGLSPTLSLSAYAELSSFVTLTAGTYRVRITASGDQSTVLFDFTAGLAVSGTTVLTLLVLPRSSGSLPNVTALPEQATGAVLVNELV
jgi:hypothetical protein